VCFVVAGLSAFVSDREGVGETAYIEVVGFVLLNRFINKNIAAVCIRYNYSKANSCF